jgi:hypothetical protein
MRGERIEVPPVEEEPLLQPGDTIQWTPGIDSLLDSLRAPVETLPPGSIETQPANTVESLPASSVESLSAGSVPPLSPVPVDSSAPAEDATPREVGRPTPLSP